MLAVWRISFDFTDQGRRCRNLLWNLMDLKDIRAHEGDKLGIERKEEWVGNQLRSCQSGLHCQNLLWTWAQLKKVRTHEGGQLKVERKEGWVELIISRVFHAPSVNWLQGGHFNQVSQVLEVNWLIQYFGGNFRNIEHLKCIPLKNPKF